MEMCPEVGLLEDLLKTILKGGTKKIITESILTTVGLRGMAGLEKQIEESG